jgi:hypothetical protein
MPGGWRRVAILLALVLGGTMLLDTSGCVTFAGSDALQAVDFCAIFDCTGGFLGGVINPCGDPTTRDDDLLLDCPAPIGGA